MAGSQLKQLKEVLRSKGLVGQTNIKRKNKKISSSDTRRDQEERRREVGKIRDEFNQFDKRYNRSKHDFTVISGGKFVKAGSKQHNDSTKAHSSVEKAMRLDYDSEKKHKNRVGGLIDKRFGESNRNLTEEERMLQRFTRERQSSSKKNVFSLGSDDEYDVDDGFVLTHSGKKLDFADGATHGEDSDDTERPDLGASQKRFVDEGSIEAEPARKKSKKEVMAEIIAKSKFHKRQRQMAFEKTQEDIMDLDDEFADVVGEINSQGKKSSTIVAKSQQDIDYDAKVRELTYDRRAVPADRTKTEEEISREHSERMKKLEEARLKRMTGLQDDEEQVADDLGDDFWEGSDDEGAQNEVASSSIENESEGTDKSDDDTSTEDWREKRKMNKKSPALSMPTTYSQFDEHTKSMSCKETISYIKKLLELYHPRLAQGNKQKTDQLVGMIFEHILTVGGHTVADTELVNALTKLTRSMAEQYNETLVEVIRTRFTDLEQRVAQLQLEKRDLVFFAALGFCFSTSDHYHLVITPALILLNQFLGGCIASYGTLSVQQLGQGLMVCEILTNYQVIAKRYDPEVLAFLEKCVLSLIPEPAKVVGTLSGKPKATNSNLSKQYKPATYTDGPFEVNSLFVSSADDDALKFQLIGKATVIMDKCVQTWREKSCGVEILQSILSILKALAKYFSLQLPRLGDTISRYAKLASNLAQSRKPLTLQEHRRLAIKTMAPKFEENFNPDKKSYDVNKERQELSKMKAQIKKENKSALKDIRKQTKFVARQQIEEKKDMYSEYHRKMANIVNSISTVEGAEKNQYEREKKRRQNQR